tara:strand:- start:315 stop:596 length:282 start_codon:yes stop_codon:yes gene_type:complete
MKVYVGTMRYIYDGDITLVVATTRNRIEQELVSKAQVYVEYLDAEEKESLDTSDGSFDAWREIGWRNEWFDLQWTLCDVHSDDHILKYAMETI